VPDTMTYSNFIAGVPIRYQGRDYIVLGQKWGTQFVGNNEALVTHHLRLGRILASFLRWIDRHRQWVAKYDMESLDIKEGEIAPMYSGTYWLSLPYRFVNRFFPTISLENFKI